MSTGDTTNVGPDALPLFQEDCEIARNVSGQSADAVCSNEPQLLTIPPEVNSSASTLDPASASPIRSASASLSTPTLIDPCLCEPFEGAPRAGTDFLDSRDGELAANIQKNGVLEPIVVWADGERIRVLSGNRRCAVVMHLRQMNVAVDLPARSFEGNAVDALAFAHSCNEGRHKPTAMEQAKAVGWAIKNLGKPQVQIARALGLDDAKVSRLLTLASLPAFVLEAATDANSLSENFAGQLQASLQEPEKVALMKERAKELVELNKTMGGPQLARFLLTGTQQPNVQEIEDPQGQVIGRLTTDRHGALNLKVPPGYLQPDAPFKDIVNAIGLQIFDTMKAERKRER